MFIKKDLRKIPKILADAAPSVQEPPSVDPEFKVDETEEPASKRAKKDLLTELNLARRKAEFRGSVSIICHPKNAPSLRHLKRLSLYDCEIRSLDGIGMLASPLDGRQSCCPDLEELDLGRNPISTLPDELALLSDSLKHLRCDDCRIAGPIPACILQLENLETLRMSNNKVSSIPREMGNLSNLRILCLDRNEIEEVPPELSNLEKLQSMLLRQNKIAELPEGVPGETMPELTLFHASSNKLKSLPSSIAYCSSLENVYVNSNNIERFPLGLSLHLNKLQRLNASHNKLERISSDFKSRFGEPNETGICEKGESCVVILSHNPLVKKIEEMNGDNLVENSRAISVP